MGFGKYRKNTNHEDGRVESIAIVKKKAAYGALKKEQRINFWNRKFDNVLTLNWSQEEQKHILKARNFVMEHQDYFSGKDLTDEQQNIVDLFCYEWSEIA